MIKEIEAKFRALLSHPYILIACGLLPCFLALFVHFKAENKLAHQIEKALYLKERHILAERKGKLEEAQSLQMQKANSDYLENSIESMQFLRPEIQKLTAMLHSSPDNKTDQTRLDFLQNGKNTLRFRQQNFQRVGQLQEMEAKQVHPVEMNREDLKKLLASIENITIGDVKPVGSPPNLLIKHFELIKKPLPTNEEAFLVNLELIKREMIHD